MCWPSRMQRPTANSCDITEVSFPFLRGSGSLSAVPQKFPAFAASLALYLVSYGYAQAPATASDAGIAALRSFASDLEKCPDAFAVERPWGKGRSEVERIYLGHPKNVVWRSAQVESRAVGYIEFSSSIYVRVPAETAKKYTRRRVVEPANLPVTADGVAFLPTEDAFPFPDTRYRYEFDLRPDGISLAKMFRAGPDGKWQAEEKGYPCTPALK